MFEVKIYAFDPITRKHELWKVEGPMDEAAAEKRASWSRYCGQNAEVVPVEVTVDAASFPTLATI